MSHMLQINLSDEEYRRFSEAAQASGMTLHDYLFSLASKPRPVAYLGAIGNVEIKSELEGRGAQGKDDPGAKRRRGGD